MASLTSPTNSNSLDLDPVVLDTGVTGYAKRAVPGTNATPTGSTSGDIATVQVGTLKDDAAFTVGTTAVVTIGGLADETSPDSVDEGDTGALRMTLDRFLLVEMRNRRNTTATVTTPAAGTAAGTVLASNTSRNGATIYNGSTALCYLKLGTAAGTTSYTTQLFSNDYYEVPFGYTGVITGTWTAASGSAFVTEITI